MCLSMAVPTAAVLTAWAARALTWLAAQHRIPVASASLGLASEEAGMSLSDCWGQALAAPGPTRGVPTGSPLHSIEASLGAASSHTEAASELLAGASRHQGGGRGRPGGRVCRCQLGALCHSPWPPPHSCCHPGPLHQVWSFQAPLGRRYRLQVTLETQQKLRASPSLMGPF
ncbi:hypothetical protein MC885_021626 [Smutsia gigantea]|nr:hypothetical protein MC885_021626 [Smutsia gigantea]